MLKHIKNLSTELNQSNNASSIVRVLSNYFKPFGVSELNIYIFDETSETLRNFAKNWLMIEEFLQKKHAKEVYEIFNKLGTEATIQTPKTIYYPLKNQSKVIGMIEIIGNFEENFFKLLDYIIFNISLKVQNVILVEKMQKNIDFHDSMKNIAKIIETQYDITYIIPIIGEMIDKFVSEHLIYIFVMDENDNELKLVWPGACKDTKIFELIKCLNNKSDYILTPDKKVGIFPLITENLLKGCIVTKSVESALSEKEIDYIEQLSNQAATTIDRASVYAEILQHATLDALTGFNNRRQLEERIRQEVASSKRQKLSLCSIMLDIDYFKKINDTYGHAVGDFVLKNISMVIKRQLREYDIAGRYGGEEFAILLPYTNLIDAQMVAERLRLAVEKHQFDISKINPKYKNINVTISLGVYQYEHDKNEEDLLKFADVALYKAKDTGRNKVVVYE